MIMYLFIGVVCVLLVWTYWEPFMSLFTPPTPPKYKINPKSKLGYRARPRRNKEKK